MGDRVREVRGYAAASRAVLLAAPALALASYFLIGFGDRSGLPAATPELSLWQLLVAVQVLVWTLLAGFGIRGLGRLQQRFAGRWPAGRAWQTLGFLAGVYALLGLLLVLGGIAGLRNPFLLPGQAWKVPLLHLVAGVGVAPFLVTLKWIQLRAVDDWGWTATARNIEDVRFLRGSLRTATAAVGAVVALAVIATGALRNAVAAAGLLPYPPQFAVVYGAVLTGVVAAVYLYAFSALDGRARSLLDSAVPLCEPRVWKAQEYSDRTKMRAELAQELELGGDPRKNLEGLIAVFSPLVAALLSQLGGLGGS